MYDRFTDRARKVMNYANQEAHKCNHDYIGTEHILLGLIREDGVAAQILRNMKVNTHVVALEVENLITRGPDRVAMGKLPQTPTTKMVIEIAIQKAREMCSPYVGTEHILLGLTLDEGSIAHTVLSRLGVCAEEVFEEIKREPVGMTLDEMRQAFGLPEVKASLATVNINGTVEVSREKAIEIANLLSPKDLLKLAYEKLGD